MILYIHGFASGVNSKKVVLLHERFNNVVTLNLNPEPKIAVKQLENFIEKHYKQTEITLIGSSLGGFYAMYLYDKYKLKTILVNPAIRPWETLEQYKNKEVKNYTTEEVFYFKSEYLNQLHLYKTDNIDTSNILLLLQTGDKTLNYKDAIEFLSGAKSIIETGGSHQFEKFELYFDIINDYVTTDEIVATYVKA
jgi:hypothetical protein